MYSRLKSIVNQIRLITDFIPEIAIVLGSGLGGFANRFEAVATIDYNDIEGFPKSTVSGHKGRFVFGFIGGKRIVALDGRVHYYEGYSSAQTVIPVRTAIMLGAKTVILTNAAGGINESFSQGDLMLITDHIGLVPSPLIGKNIDELGPRFPDMSAVYNKAIQSVALKSAQNVGVDLKSGVYIQLTGPNYETPAEVKMCRILGADAVGMSTANEAVAARHAGAEVCGISLITNMASGISKNKLSHEEVKETADKSGENFAKLILEIIKNV